jgi:hypothetical protein
VWRTFAAETYSGGGTHFPRAAVVFCRTWFLSGLDGHTRIGCAATRYTGVFWLVLIGAAIRYLPRKVPKVNWNVSLPSITATREWWTKAAIACLVLAGLLILVNDLSPEIFFDSLHYHLALPNLYLVNHRVYNEPNFELSGLVMNVQMLWDSASRLEMN